MREFRPHVVTTYDENGGYPHPDHIMCHKISVAAFDAAGDPERYPEAGEPWQPLKLYYHIGFTRRGSSRCTRACSPPGSSRRTGRWLETWVGRRRDTARRVTTRVECGEYFAGPRRRAARARHPGRPGRVLVPGAAGDPAAGLADRGLRAGPVAGRQPDAGRTTCSPACGNGRAADADRVGCDGAYRSATVMASVTALDMLAENNFGDTRSGGLAGPMGLLIIVLLAIATVLLIRNMNARLRRLPDRFPDPDEDRGQGRCRRRGLDRRRPDYPIPPLTTSRSDHTDRAAYARRHVRTADSPKPALRPLLPQTGLA